MVKSTKSYQRTFEELEEVASKFWPAELSELEAKLSVIPLLLETQDHFISVISVKTPDLDRLFNILEASSLPANLFLKHLAILADFGGEPLQRVSREFEMLFPEGKLNYYWQGKPHSYTFRSLPHLKFSNQSLHIDGRLLVEQHPLDDLKRDAIALLLFGRVHNQITGSMEAASFLAKCHIGEYLGRPNILKKVVQERYIWMSPLVKGSSESQAP
jgi:hypothetical protein